MTEQLAEVELRRDEAVALAEHNAALAARFNTAHDLLQVHNRKNNYFFLG